MARLAPRTPRAQRALAVIACAAVALVASLAAAGHVTLLPPGWHGFRDVQVATASTQVLIDRPVSAIGNTRTETGEFDALADRAVLLGQLMASEPVLEDIGRRAHVDPASITATARVTANVQAVMTEPDLERRADQIVHASFPYKIDVQPRPNLPELDIYTQAPTAEGAVALANAAVAGLRDHLDRTARAEGRRPEDQIGFAQLGAAHGGVVNGKARMVILGFTFVVVLFIGLGLLGAIGRIRRGWRASAAAERAARDAAAAHEADAAPGNDGAPAPPLPPPSRSPATAPAPRPALGLVPIAAGPRVLAPALPGTAVPVRPASATRARAAGRQILTAAGDWPRTTRLLPWSMAVFMAVIWLVPFNVIQLSASLPLDLKFDRLILPGIIGLWVIALAVGGPSAPRLRITLIHVALAGIVATACLSIVLNATSLSHTLELLQGVKKLTLLLSYVSVFLIITSSLRPSEIPAFIRYTLVLACICAVGTVWEYRFHYNVFYDVPAKLLPGVFTVGVAESSAVDEIGRRLVRGPADIPLEMVAMITMAFPIALVGLLQGTTRKSRIWHAIATCLLLAAAVSTYRKSAFMAPIAVVLTLAYFLRGKLLRLAPVGVLGLAAIHVLSPGAFGSIAFQLNSNRLGVTTVSDRTSDYDAVRADLWSHLAFGRGFGTYEHISYRVLDMEMLKQLMEVGIVGLTAYVGLAVTIVIVAVRLIHSPFPTAQGVGLIAAAAAVAYLVVSTLFDVMSFPHCPYILLTLAGFLAVASHAPSELEPHQDDG